jgi:hypothetical protein
MAHTNHTTQQRGSHRRSDARWAAPHDPKTNARPPGNGDLDRRAADNSRERLLAALGR